MASRRTPPSDTPAKPVTTPPEPALQKQSRATRVPASRPAVTPDKRRGMIAEAAYLRAERRGFAPGYEEEDWLAAEVEVDKLLSADQRAPQ
jgi:DUF2934 family protein